MKKEWKNYDQFRHLDPPGTEWTEVHEGILDADRNWTPKGEGDPPIGGEHAKVDVDRRT